MGVVDAFEGFSAVTRCSGTWEQAKSRNRQGAGRWGNGSVSFPPGYLHFPEEGTQAFTAGFPKKHSHLCGGTSTAQISGKF